MRKRVGPPRPKHRGKNGKAGLAHTGGPANCMRTAAADRRCNRCGTSPTTIHVPTRAQGVFCPGCCPVCNAAPAAPVAWRKQDALA